MAHINIRAHSATCAVSAVGSAQVFKLGPVKAGDRIMHAACRRLVAAAGGSTSTFQLALTNGGVLGSTIDPKGTVNTVVDAGSVATTVTADDVLELRYTPNTGGATAPTVRVLAAVAKNQGHM